jgi:hypothetical protein
VGFDRSFAASSVRDVLKQPVNHVLELDTEARPTTEGFPERRLWEKSTAVKAETAEETEKAAPMSGRGELCQDDGTAG